MRLLVNLVRVAIELAMLLPMVWFWWQIGIPIFRRLALTHQVAFYEKWRWLHEDTSGYGKDLIYGHSWPIFALVAIIMTIVFFTERASSRQNPSHAEERSSHP